MRKIRYAVVGLGYISQVAVLPAFKHAKNAELTALISSDSKKLIELGKKYRVKNLYTYDQYIECLESEEIDAVYIAVPNPLHKKFVLRAAEYRKHILCEKPLGVTENECEEMIEAADVAGVKLMTAYRLHFDSANLTAAQWVNSGKIGKPRAFDSFFSVAVKDHGIRLAPRNQGGGPLYDIGIYCINAARNLFQEEPVEVLASAANAGIKSHRDIDETVSVVLRFPSDRIANFVCSFGCAPFQHYRVIGTKGEVYLENSYEYVGKSVLHLNTADGKRKAKSFQSHDQFAPELIYFSNCIVKDRTPEPSGFEGLADIRVIEAIFRSIDLGTPVKLNPLVKKERPTLKLAMRKPPVKKWKLVDAEEPSQDEAA